MTSPAYWRRPASPKLDLLGKTFGLLTVIRESPSDGHGARWRVRCECGAERTLPAKDIVRGAKTHRNCRRET